MRVHVVHAHPLETSFGLALAEAVVAALEAEGHAVDALDLYAEHFAPALTRAERLAYDDVPDNIGAEIAPYVARLRAAEALVFVHPVWNFGAPAILKGYFDRVLLPGVAFTLENGRLRPALGGPRHVAFVTTYGAKRWQAALMGDPPRRVARRWGWQTFGVRPSYDALYDLPGTSDEQRRAFVARVAHRLVRRFAQR